MKILLAEDQAMVRGALAALLTLACDSLNEIEIVEVEDGDKAMQQLKTDSFDLLLTDIEMPGKSGLELSQWLQQQRSQTKVIILTTFGRAGYIKRALEYGVGGFLLKDAPSEDLINAIKQVMAGKRVIDPELAFTAIGEIDPLNDKERRALRLASEGLSTSDIASQLFIAEGTVRNYLSEAISKLNASNRIDAARIAKQKGWL
ncbi:response regulator transcription factor [Shewanella frigidimarina]|jgi:two-component system response regulator DesR|uniref:Two component transcriptional regulator, LuxR family n=2 Tax=Gammaproteobacteria TaxID=1236 RepID=Q088U5_SHEFN|nr:MULTISPECIES: response regulator transcription factor [Shewanella]MBB1382702.1 response regulator transcription factor [Shewanella sp. SR41-2]ABI70220.1 two component transcriptional regulator, LuxR family [Shewanella frigidimarina NCIMB 400]PKI07577.1 DNA-binding response regulator [Shewanella sp. 11B5]RPA31987.1 DNA-binding response regulator [Shewanella frigidimarina]RPA58746.1 DNA-binding response regulator [Shewanella frigidimarina]|tara:strand:+ start:1059 stop:1667 length:609 start_codon:yes stop_codon:yes gene_type:complete